MIPCTRAEARDTIGHRMDARSGSLAVRFETAVTARAMLIVHVRQEKASAMLHVAVTAVFFFLHLHARQDLRLEMGRSVVTALAGIVADFREPRHMALLAASFKNGVGARDRTIEEHLSASAEEKRDGRHGRRQRSDPDQLAQPTQAARIPLVVRGQALRQALGAMRPFFV